MKRVSVFNMLLILTLLINSSCKSNDYKKIGPVYGHAGTALSEERYIYPPNTQVSIDYALQVLAADGVEVDVQMTADGELVLFHDQTTDETTNRAGCINSFTLSEIKEFDYYKNYKIASLTDVLPGTVSSGHKIILDLKHYNQCENRLIDFDLFNAALNKAMKTLSAIEKSNIIVNAQNIEMLNALTDTKINKSLEIDDINKGINFVESNSFDFLMLKLTQMTKEEAKKLNENNIQIGLFNIKTTNEIKQALDFEFAFLISDNIPKTKHLLKQ